LSAVSFMLNIDLVLFPENIALPLLSAWIVRLVAVIEYVFSKTYKPSAIWTIVLFSRLSKALVKFVGLSLDLPSPLPSTET